MKNTIEKLIKKHLDEKLVLMSTSDTDLLIQMVYSEESESVDTNKMYNDLRKKSWVLQALEKRIENRLTISISKPMLIFILFINDGNIGQCIIYLYYLQYKAKELGIKKINNAVFCDKIFPLGMLDKNSMHEFWLAQKSKIIGEDNMIDFPKYAESLMH